MKKNQGITIIALIIAIIVLIILASITISLILGDNGIITKATNAGKEYEEKAAREKLEISLADLQVEKSTNSNYNETIFIDDKLTSQNMTVNEDIITVDGYMFQIDRNILEIVNSLGKEGKDVPNIKTVILNNEYQFGGTVQIKVTANVKEGKIISIENSSGATIKENISDTEKVYEVVKQGEYSFTAITDNDKKITTKIKINTILENPDIIVKELKKDGFKIEIKNNYPTGVITQYQYYMGNNIIKQGDTNSFYTVTGLTDNTLYQDIKVIAHIGEGKSKESNKISVITGGDWSDIYDETKQYFDGENTAWIPKGFQVSTKETENKISDGLVVRKNSDGNEFVWIPVDLIPGGYNIKDWGMGQTASYYSEIYTENIEENKKIINEITESIKKYNGYYIGRYETGNKDGKAISKNGANVYNNINWKQAISVAGQLYNRETDNVQSRLINNRSWDTALKFIALKNSTYPTNSAGKGWYSAITYITGTPLDSKISNRISNIYDMAGNMWEMTADRYGNRVSGRGGTYGMNGYWAGYRDWADNAEYVSHRLGFRLTLYL